MGYFATLENKRPDAAISTLLAYVVNDATTNYFKGQVYEGEWPNTGFGITNIRACDVARSNQNPGNLNGNVAGSSIWGVTAVTLSTWTDWVNLTIDIRSYHVPVGVFNRTLVPHVIRVRPRASGQDLPSVDLENLYAFEDQAWAYLSKPYSVAPGKNHTIRVLTDATISGTPAERIGISGYIVATQAYLITESV